MIGTLADKILAATTLHGRNLRKDCCHWLPIFADTPYFLSEEFSLVDCYIAPLLWRLPAYGIQLEGQGAKDIKAYMIRVFERKTFQESLTDAEKELAR